MAELVPPVSALAGLILAFVLVQTFISYRDARQASVTEASAVLTQSRAAALLREPAATEVQRSLACYARSVVSDEWPRLDARRSSRLPDRWAETTLASVRDRAGADAGGSVLSAVISADAARTTGRRIRLAEALPSVPSALLWLLIGVSAAFVFLYSALTDPSVSRRAQRTILATTTVVLAGTLVVILDLDRPYGGLAEVKPFAMRAVQAQIVRRVPGGGAGLPCDPQGRPVSGA